MTRTRKADQGKPPEAHEHHCSSCCPPIFRIPAIVGPGCRCKQMVDGVITVFEDKGSRWVCRRCAGRDEKGAVC